MEVYEPCHGLWLGVWQEAYRVEVYERAFLHYGSASNWKESNGPRSNGPRSNNAVGCETDSARTRLGREDLL